MQGAGFVAAGSGCRIWGVWVGFSVEVSGFRVQGSGLRLESVGCQVCGVGLGV